jgi:hypothetical protein
MFTDDQYLAISGLAHIAFCERRCALIHLEQIWTENVLTTDGQNSVSLPRSLTIILKTTPTNNYEKQSNR